MISKEKLIARKKKLEIEIYKIFDKYGAEKNGSNYTIPDEHIENFSKDFLEFAKKHKKDMPLLFIFLINWLDIAYSNEHSQALQNFLESLKILIKSLKNGNPVWPSLLISGVQKLINASTFYAVLFKNIKESAILARDRWLEQTDD